LHRQEDGQELSHGSAEANTQVSLAAIRRDATIVRSGVHQ
jgi:hypothetical protein